jgi:hypothetical protein
VKRKIVVQCWHIVVGRELIPVGIHANVSLGIMHTRGPLPFLHGSVTSFVNLGENIHIEERISNTFNMSCHSNVFSEKSGMGATASSWLSSQVLFDLKYVKHISW